MTDICHKLERLTLSPRAPECLVPALIPHMGGLRALTSLMLRCRGPPITSFTWEGFAEAVSRLVCLRQLHLYPLDGLPPRWMSNLFNSLRSAPHLEALHLSGTDPNQPLVVGNAFGELLLSVPHLTRVCLQNAEIEPSQLFWKALHKMPRLAKLSLWNTEVRSRSERYSAIPVAEHYPDCTCLVGLVCGTQRQRRQKPCHFTRVFRGGTCRACASPR